MAVAAALSVFPPPRLGQRQPFSGPFHGARKMAVRSRPSCFRGPAVPSHQHAMAGAPRFARRLPCNHSHKLVILSAAKDLSAVLHTPPLLYVQKNCLPEHFRCTYRFAIAYFIARLGRLGAFEHETGPSGARVGAKVLEVMQRSSRGCKGARGGGKGARGGAKVLEWVQRCMKWGLGASGTRFWG
jgi:hypothetical protein